MSLYRNKENYYDPTAGSAIANMLREERRQRKIGYRPLTYIVSRYSGDISKNTEDARRYCRFAVEQGRIPICSHLLFPQFLHDNDPKERELGCFFGMVLMNRCKEIWIFSDGEFSSGMQEEYDHARRHGSRIRYFTTECCEIESPGKRGGDGPL